jgi:hypothetical protein
MCPGVDSPSKNEYQVNPGGKGGRCVRLTTYHFHVLIIKKSEGLNLLEPCGPVQACNGTALPFFNCLVCHYLVISAWKGGSESAIHNRTNLRKADTMNMAGGAVVKNEMCVLCSTVCNVCAVQHCV